jgi:threonine/homoserine/homoserine lactone efflux protein
LTPVQDETDYAMDLTYFLRGLVIGVSIAAPVGPIGVLCIRRTLAEGRAAGFVSGLGAASADAVYGFMAAFGLTFISTFLVAHQSWIRLVGGLFLLFLGVRTLTAPVSEKAAEVRDRGLLGNYLSIFLLTLTNPLTILSFAAVFAGLGVGAAGGDYLAATTTVLGVFVGSALWWLTLSVGVSLFRGRMTSSAMIWVNRVSGCVIVLFGLAAVASLVV